MTDSTRPWVPYGVAVLTVVAATVARWALDGVFGADVPFMTYVMAVACAAWYGGLRPSLLAMVLGYFAASYFFVRPSHGVNLLAYDSRDWVRMVGYVTVSLTISGFSEAFRRTQRLSAAQRRHVTSILESINDGFIGVDAQWRLTYMNRAAEQMGQRRRVDSLGRNFWELFRHLQGTNVEHALRRAADTQTTVEFEAYHEPSARWFELKASPSEPEGLAIYFRDVTQRKLDSVRLAQHRELLQVTIASIGDAVIATDRQGHVTFLNPIAEHLTGWNSAEAEGRPLDDVFCVINEVTRQPIATPCESGQLDRRIPGHMRHSLLVGRHGRECLIDDSTAPIKDRDGNELGVILVFRDVTALRQSTEAKERLAAIVENSHDAMIGLDLKGTILSWNRGAEALFGFTPGEAVGQSIEIVIPPERRHEFLHSIARLKNGEYVEHADTVRRRKDGTSVDVSTRISPICNAEGEVVGASKVSHNISERKRSERAVRFLAEAGEILFKLVDHQSTMQKVARLAVPYLADWCIVDIINANGQIERTAYAHSDPASEGILRELVERYPLDWNSPSISVKALRSGKPELVSELPDALIQRVAKDDAHRQLLTALAPQSCLVVPITSRRQTVGSLVFVSAKSGRRYSLSDIDLAVELARRAATAIENSRLYRDLEEAKRQKDDFLAMLAHELRNPLAAIQYANQLSKLEEHDSANTNIIERQVKNLARLVDDLLDVSRITRDKIQLKKEPLDGRTVLDRAVASVRSGIEERRHTLACEIADHEIPIDADATRIEQILVNLLTNAIKYTPEGGNITVCCHTDEQWAVFKVRDSGIGIPAEMLPRVFELFTQVDRTLDRSQGGLGIGLTVVRRLAEMHGGTVSATSPGLGRGSEFTLRLPLSKRSRPLLQQDDPQEAARPMRVLVVDDNIDTAKTLSMLLKTTGHCVLTTHDGHSALDEVARFKPDVVLLDLGLPGIDGYGVAETLRRQRQFDHVRLVAVSGYGQPEDRIRTRDAGFDCHLVKPVSFKDLTTAIATVQAAAT